MERLDPRTKLLAVLLLAVLIFLFNSEESILTATAIVIAGIGASRVSPLALIKKLRFVLWFLIIITGVNMFTLSGDTLFELGGKFATREGLGTGLVLSAKIVLMLWASLILVSTTSIAGVMDALETLGRPFRKRLGPVIMVMNLTLNFVPSLVHKAQRIKIAQIARGADVDSGFSRQVHFAFSAALPLFASAFRSSEQLALAMEARCYDPSAERSHFSTLRMTQTDWLVVGGMLCCLAVFMISSRWQ